jgi:hypothetical protein
VNEVAMAISDNRAKEWDPMSDEKKNLPDGAAGEDHDTEKEIDSSAVSVGSETEEEGSSQTPEERLEQIAADHDVPVDRDPKEAQAAGEGAVSSDDSDSSLDNGRDVRGGDTKEDEDTSSEPPD